MKFKLLGLILAVLVIVSGIAGMVLAGSPSDVQFVKIEVDDNDVSGGDLVYVERSDDVDVSVSLRAQSVDDIEDLKLRAWLGGYEDEVEDVSSMFDLVPGVTRTIDLNLQLPDDMDASKAYILHAEVYNADGSKEYTANLGTVRLQIEEARHRIRIKDIIYSTEVNSGSLLYTKVRVENTGSKDEKDVKVSVSIPTLGVATRDYIDKLVWTEDDDDDVTSDSIELALRIPENAVSGDYELQVDVEYNNGRELTSATRMIQINGIAAGAGEMVISVDTTSQDVVKGEEATFKLMFANLGNKAITYSVETTGADAWADVKVNPAFVSLAPGQAGEVMINLKAKEEALAGSHAFVARINAGENTVKELGLNANVKEAGYDLGSLKTGLEIGFAIIVILLVILGLIVAFYKIGGKKEEKPSEPESLSEESYY